MIPSNEILQFIKENNLKTNKHDKIEFYELFLLDILRDTNKEDTLQEFTSWCYFYCVVKILHLGRKP